MLGTPNGGIATTGRNPDLGFRRVTLVRMRPGATGTRFEVDGIVHRHPTTRSVSAGLASRLVASGVPLVIRADPVDEVAAC